MAGYCSQCNVKYTAREHYCVQNKVCQVCHQEKPIAAFPPHASSMDGHKHTCTACWEGQRARERASQREQKQQRAQQKIQRAKDNEVLCAYGSRWKKEAILVEFIDDCYEEERWVLYSPLGKQIEPEEALQEIAHLQMHKPGHPSTLWARDLLALPNVVVLDTETTGFRATDEIIDIAIVDGQGRVRLNTLVQCQQTPIPAEAKAVHHINEYMLREAPTFPQLWERLMRFLSTREIVIYNAEYDLRMLKQTAQRYGLPLPELHVHCLMTRYSDYLAMPSSSSKGYRSMSLAAACFHFQIEQQSAHRALVDTQTALCLLQKLAALADGV